MEKRTTKSLINHFIIIAAFLAYLAVGIGIYRDYGISSDEPTERISTLVNVKYILTFLGHDHAAQMEVPELETYSDRYYGTLLQMPSVVFEAGDQGLGDIFYGRHLYTFGLCFMGYITFFFLCKMLLKSNLLGILGTMMIALYPRFFAEQFYNIKDMVFVSVFMISMLVTVKLIESKFNWKWIFLFALSTAVSTNVRIVGIIFLLLILGYLLLDGILGKVAKSSGYEAQCKHPLQCGAILLLLYLMMFMMTLPITWKNPIQGVFEVFVKFSNYDNWDSTIVFMGNVISKTEIPWFYIPVWILLSVPIWYILLFVVTVIICVCLCVKKAKKNDKFLLTLVSEYKYVLWCTLLMAVPWLGIAVMHSTIYNGWRHCYFLLPPMVLFSLFGVNYLIKRGKKYGVVLLAIIVLGGGSQITWMWNNHPYEMVYFNNIGKHFGEYFDRDYWHLATLDAFRYIAQNEENSTFSVKTSGNNYYRYFLDEEERARIVDEEEPLYYIESYRGKVGNDLKKDGYAEIYSIVVDNFKILSVYKKEN